MSATPYKSQTTSARKQMRSWMRQEYSRLNYLLGVMAFCVVFYSFFYSLSYKRSTSPGIVAGVAVILFVFVVLPHLLCTKFAIKHSAVGRQLKSFGDFNTVYAEILTALQSPLYTNGTEIISGKYIFLMTEPPHAPQFPAFQNPGRLLVLPVEWLARVSIKPNEPYPDEMNTVIFRTQHPLANATSSNSVYTMTIHMDADATAELVDTITAHITSEPFAEEIFRSCTQSAAPKKHAAANSYPFKSTRTPAARFAARFRSNPLRELRAGKMRVFRLVILFIVLVNVGAMLFLYFLQKNHTLSTLPRDFIRFIHRDVLGNPQALAFLLALLAFYLIPAIAIYVLIQRWYRGFLAEYEKLPQQEQQELLEKLCDNFETGQPVVIYTERCFCFRDAHRFSFQVLLPYSSVLWMYRSHNFFQINNSPSGLSTEVNFYRLIVRTENRKKYCIPSGDEPKLSKRIPDAVVGYGDIQRETYLDKVRERKK